MTRIPPIPISEIDELERAPRQARRRTVVVEVPPKTYDSSAPDAPANSSSELLVMSNAGNRVSVDLGEFSMVPWGVMISRVDDGNCIAETYWQPSRAPVLKIRPRHRLSSTYKHWLKPYPRTVEQGVLGKSQVTGYSNWEVSGLAREGSNSDVSDIQLDSPKSNYHPGYLEHFQVTAEDWERLDYDQRAYLDEIKGNFPWGADP